jgi:putative ABC transport system permease protein
MQGLFQDVRFGLRTLVRHRHFTVTAVFVLALGIGATTAVFSVVNAVLLRPLPYVDPERLVAVTSVYESGRGPRPSPVIPLSDMAEWRTRAGSFDSMGAFAYTQLPVRVGNWSFLPVTALMDPQFLPTLGNALALGSFFDLAPAGGVERTAIVSHTFWRDALGAEPSALGRTITVDGEPYVLRGVLAADFQFPRSDASYYETPIELLIPSSSFTNFPPASRQWFGIARLKPGVTLASAEAELQSIARGLAPKTAAGGVWSVKLTALGEETTRRSRQALLTVLAISVVLLLIAATNLMNLFFSRSATRLAEISIRRAIGGSFARIVRQLLVEGLLLAAAGAAIGILLAAFALDALVAMSPLHLPVTGSISIDRTVLAFTVALAVTATLIAGFFPAFHIGLKADEAVRNPGMRTSASRGVARVQQALCVAQVALGMSLLASAGLLARSLQELSAVEPGFATDRIIGFNLSVPNDVSLEERARFYSRALEEVRTIPGVERAGMISFLPPETRAGVFMGLGIQGEPPPEPGAPPRVVNTLVSSPDYFSTLQLPVVAGRDFTPGDTAGRPPVIIVNEALVRRYLGGRPAVGRRIGTGFDGLEPVREIIGVVRDSHDRGLAAQPMPTVYIPFAQFSLPYGSIAVKTAGAADTIVPVIRDRIQRLNTSVPLTDFQALDERLYQSLREPRFYTLTAAACALMAVLFVTFGLYGLVSYSVSRRIPELGIRMAVGAAQRTIQGMVLGQGLRMALIGVVIGLALSMIFTRGLETLLFRVKPIDPLTLTLSAAVVVLVTLAASFVPARRASRIDPVTALRHQ